MRIRRTRGRERYAVKRAARRKVQAVKRGARKGKVRKRGKGKHKEKKTGNAKDENVKISDTGINFDMQVFTAPETRKLKQRYDALARGRDHITREDFLSQPEIGCNPLISRVVEVVLEENGHSTRRYFEGQLIESRFGTGEKERDIGIHFDPAVMAGPKKKTPFGAIIEEVVPGGIGAMKGNLHSGMKLIAVRGADDDDWRYCMGLPYKTAQKMVFKAKRPMTLLFQDPEDPKIKTQHEKKLKAVDKSFGGGGFLKLDLATGSDSESDSSESDEEELVDSKGFKLEVRKRQYEVEFTETNLAWP